MALIADDLCPGCGCVEHAGFCVACGCLDSRECTCTPHMTPAGYGFNVLHHPECPAYVA